MYRPPETIKCGCGYDTGIGVVSLYCVTEDIKCPKCGMIIIHANKYELKADMKYRSDDNYRLNVDNRKVPVTC